MAETNSNDRDGSTVIVDPFKGSVVRAAAEALAVGVGVISAAVELWNLAVVVAVVVVGPIFESNVLVGTAAVSVGVTTASEHVVVLSAGR